jgi:ribosomal protein L24E
MKARPMQSVANKRRAHVAAENRPVANPRRVRWTETKRPVRVAHAREAG